MKVPQYFTWYDNAILQKRWAPYSTGQMTDKIMNPRLKKFLLRISKNVNRIRRESNLTQAEVAEKLNCDIRWLQRITSGTHEPSIETIARLAAVFKVDESEFFKQ